MTAYSILSKIHWKNSSSTLKSIHDFRIFPSIKNKNNRKLSILLDISKILPEFFAEFSELYGKFLNSRFQTTENKTWLVVNMRKSRGTIFLLLFLGFMKNKKGSSKSSSPNLLYHLIIFHLRYHFVVVHLHGRSRRYAQWLLSSFCS